jgi:hypothetical protein
VSKGKIMMWDKLDYSIGASDGTHLIFRFDGAPKIEPVDLVLDGGSVRPGDVIRGMFGPKTSAGYENFHPIYPQAVRYLGQCGTLDSGWLALCELTEKRDLTSWGPYVYFGWFYAPRYQTLISLLPGNSSRLVNSDFVFLNDDLPPDECIANGHFWKKYKRQKPGGES